LQHSDVCVCWGGVGWGVDSPKSILEFRTLCNPQCDISEFRYKIWHSQRSNALNINLKHSRILLWISLILILCMYVWGEGGKPTFSNYKW